MLREYQALKPDGLWQLTSNNVHRIWRQPAAPPAGTYHRWTGTPHASASAKLVDGEVVARNIVPNPSPAGAVGVAVNRWVATRSTFLWVEDHGGSGEFTLTDSGGYAHINRQAAELGQHWFASATFYNDTDEPGTGHLRVYDYGASSGVVLPEPISLGPGESGRVVNSRQVIEGADEVTNLDVQLPSGWHVNRVMLTLNPDVDYFDGDSPDDRANDLWLDTTPTNGTPANSPHTWDSDANEWVIASITPSQAEGMTAANLQGNNDYYIEIENPRPTTPIVTGQLESMITDGVTLVTPRSDQFGLSFVAQPRGMGAVRFGNYELNFVPEPTLTHYDPDEDELKVLATLPVAESGACQFFVSYDGEFINIGINDVSVPVEAPTQEEVEEIELLPDGGIIDMIAYWSRPTRDMEECNMYSCYKAAVNDDNSLTVKMHSEELMLTPQTRVLNDVDYIDEDGVWTITFGPGTTVEVNQELVISGELLDPAGDVVVNGVATAREYPTGVIEASPLAQVIVGALGGNDKTHPIYRAPDAGSRGSTILVPREEEPDDEGVDQIESISFWMDPHEGDIMDGVSMASGVVQGDVLINGLPYDGTVLEDRFMLTLNRVIDNAFVIHVPVTNLHISPERGNARELYESYFVRPSLSVSAGALNVDDSETFIIDATWGIVTSG